MSRPSTREIPLDLASREPRPLVRSGEARGAAPYALATRAREASQLGIVPERPEVPDRDGSLDAARGIAVGVALGMLCWLLIAALVYQIVS